ncbi:MAG: hypothetical protein H7Y37_17050 [Anaerolineae bacterium]|nr:hypothetical protein [Gloeobacterales cyanobacterium ES-bin-313]
MMESIDYQGWTITTRSDSQCFVAVVTDPSGNTFHQSTVFWYSHLSARRYAEKFIQWYTKLQDRVQDQ